MRTGPVLLALVRVTSCLAQYVGPEETQGNRPAPNVYLPNPRDSRSGCVPGDILIQVQILLKGADIDNPEMHLKTVTDPESPRFGRYWTAQEVVSVFSAPEQHTRNVLHWITESVTPRPRIQRSPCRQRLHFNAPALEVEKLLDMECSGYDEKSTGEGVTCTQNCIPRHLVNEVALISLRVLPRVTRAPVLSATNLNATKEQRLRRRQGPKDLDCKEFTTPDCLRELYKIPLAGNSSVHPNNSFGIYQTAWATWLEDDLDLFFDRFQPDLRGQRPLVQAINGGYLQTDFRGPPWNLEPNLDFQYAMALAYPQPVINIQVGDMYVNDKMNLNNMLAAFDQYYCATLDPSIDKIYPDPEYEGMEGAYNASDCGTQTPPKIISISYTWDEAKYPVEYLRHQCLEYLKLGLQGVTVIVSSGDGGVANSFLECLDIETAASNISTGRFNPSFPASCPWVTAVGGTQRHKGPDGNDSAAIEAVYSRLSNNRTVSSAGGFSNVFSIPDYQSEQTTFYLGVEDGHLKSMAGKFNQSGRGVPDVSALASEYVFAINETFRKVYGTSASAPVFASIIAKINNERLKAGKGPVGFINPVLYAHPDVFNDVVNGANSGCGVDAAFRAVKGWDAATGLGTPDYGRLLELWLSLP